MSVHGYCIYCGASFDGDLVINYPLSMGETMEDALEYASSYTGWDEYGINNRWDRKVSVYDYYSDMTVAYRCPDCEMIMKPLGYRNGHILDKQPIN